MLRPEIREILTASRQQGWVMEPEAKRILSLAGMDVPNYTWAKDEGEAAAFANKIGYPVVAKIVSASILHKSDVGGVVVNIRSDKELRQACGRFSKIDGYAGVLVEEMLKSGVELIVGAKIDYQFGPVILLGMGGTGVEIYNDTALRMAPIAERDVRSMVKGLKAKRLLEGYRGAEPVDMDRLIAFMLSFSELLMDCAELIESIDLNPVLCSADSCLAADARIMLAPAVGQ